jgi:hypothetical protein
MAEPMAKSPIEYRDFICYTVLINSNTATTSELLNQEHPTTFAPHSDSRLGSRTNRPLRSSTGELHRNFRWGAELLRWTQSPTSHMSSEGCISPTRQPRELPGDRRNTSVVR